MQEVVDKNKGYSKDTASYKPTPACGEPLIVASSFSTLGLL